MFYDQLSKEALEVINSNDDLHRYLLSLNRPKGFTPPSWLWDGENGNPRLDLDEVRAKWESYLMSRLGKKTKFEKEVLAFDLASGSKWGPQGGHPKLDAVMHDTVLPTFQRSANAEEPAAFHDPLWQKAKENRILELKQLGIANLAALKPAQVLKRVMSTRVETLSSNSGYPSFSRRKKVNVWRMALSDAESGKYREYPAILLFRRYRGKLRTVWMYPFATNIVEACYYMPLFEAMKSKPKLSSGFFSPWTGFEGVRRVVTETYGSGKVIAASDFSATDEHFVLATSLQAAEVLAACFQPKFRSGFLDSIRDMHSISLLVAPSLQISGMHGVSSGSMWTNFIETVFDWILAEYARLKSNEAVEGLYAIGDDMAWVTSWSESEFNPWLEDLGKSVGQEIKAEKTMLKPDRVKTLQRLFQRDYLQQAGEELRGVYPTIRALNSLVYPERMHPSSLWSYDMFATRVFMILENCVDHPLFEDFVRFVCSGNPRLFSWARNRDEVLDGYLDQAKSIPGLFPTYNQERKESRLSQFDSIKVARKAG